MAAPNSEMAQKGVRERLVKHSLAVICVLEPADEYCVRQQKESEKTSVSVTREGLELPEDKEEKQKQDKKRHSVKTPQGHEGPLGEKKAPKLVVSSRLVTSPCCIVTSTSAGQQTQKEW